MEIISSNKLYDPILDSQDKDANVEVLNWIANYSGAANGNASNPNGSTVIQPNSNPPRKSVLGKRASILSNSSDSKNKGVKKNITIPEEVLPAFS